MAVKTQPTDLPGRNAPWPLLVALGVSLILLLAHAGWYRFLTDDAFISFRYARNLAEGHGLVFNPGFERVEGYTNLLWVLLLAAGRVVGIAPEFAASIVSIAATVGMWAALARFVWRDRPDGRNAYLILIPLVLLALTRSVAVWSTSGLETRLFELLVVAGALRLIHEDGELQHGAARVPPLGALLFALACLTRPDGVLVAACAFGAVCLYRWRRTSARLTWTIRSFAICAGVVVAHTLFRLAYYGEWFPNTYYAKVDGRTWWSMGGRYLASFGLEYAVYLWVPLVVAALLFHKKRSSLVTPVVFGAIVIPHAIYIASIGGDHFEYRPLDLYFPFLYLLLYDGVRQLATTRRSTALTLAGAALVTAGIVELPYRAHVQFPDAYVPGFPGLRLGKTAGAVEFLDPTRSPIYRLPLLRAIAGAHRDLVRETTRHFVGIRQEEHELFLATMIPEARWLNDLLARGTIPRDTYVALNCVGAIPYYTNLRVLDQLGLTDAHVAHSPFVREMSAHGKSATWDYARESGVDLWVEESAHLLWGSDNPRLWRQLDSLYGKERERHFAMVDDSHYLVAWLPQGIEQARLRFPRLQFQSAHDLDAIRKAAAMHGAEAPFE